MMTAFHFDNTKREIGFPYQVLHAGIVKSYRQEMLSFHYKMLEFCLRFSSNKNNAVDKINGRRYETDLPHVLIKKPEMVHTFGFDDCREAVYFTYSPETAELLEKSGLVPDGPIQKIELVGELKRLVSHLMSLLAHSQEQFIADQVDLACFAILEELFFRRKLERSKSDGADNKLRRAASFIHMNLEHDLEVSQIARQFGFSERSFFRNWSKHWGCSPHQYIFAQRIQRAAYLLEHTNMSIAEIAAALKFCDGNYFITKFKSYYACTPARYRKKCGVSLKDSASTL